MIYTIGRKQSYLNGFHKYGKEFMKKGRDGDFPGGSVWQTFEEARDYAIATGSDFAVFGVLADWEKDTVHGMMNEAWHDLLIDAQLVSLEDVEVASK